MVEDLLFNYAKEHGATLIIVTHDEDLAQRCQRIIRIKDGVIDHDSAMDKATASPKAKKAPTRRSAKAIAPATRPKKTAKKATSATTTKAKSTTTKPTTRRAD